LEHLSYTVSLGAVLKDKDGQQGCKGGQCLARCWKNPPNWHSVRGAYITQGKARNERAGNFLRAKILYHLPTRWRHDVFPDVPEEGQPVLLGQKGHWVIVQNWERKKNLAVGGIQTLSCGSRAVPHNPGTGSVHCTLRRNVLDSARSLSGLEKFPLCFQEKPSYRQKEKAAREFCFWLLHSRGAFPVEIIHRSARWSQSLPRHTVSD
jgi:hypothetical protein